VHLQLVAKVAVLLQVQKAELAAVKVANKVAVKAKAAELITKL
jgi:hypothetical protein